MYIIVRDEDEGDEKGHASWFVREARAEMWTCPTCLSFWMAIPVTIIYTLLSQDVTSAPLVLLGAAGVGKTLYSLNDHLETATAVQEIVEQ